MMVCINPDWCIALHCVAFDFSVFEQVWYISYMIELLKVVLGGDKLSCLGIQKVRRVTYTKFDVFHVYIGWWMWHYGHLGFSVSSNGLIAIWCSAVGHKTFISDLFIFCRVIRGNVE